MTIGDRDIDFIVDTGASVNVISHDTYSKIPGIPTLCGPVPKVFAYGSRTELPLLGKFSAELCYKDTKLRDTILVTKTPSESLLCFKSAEALGLVSIVYKVSPSQSIQETYPELFRGLGKLKGIEVKLHIDQSIPPVAQKL